MKREYRIGPIGSIVGVVIPWLIGVVMVVKWVVEGLF